jgi:hypothetical protein
MTTAEMMVWLASMADCKMMFDREHHQPDSVVEDAFGAIRDRLIEADKMEARVKRLRVFERVVGLFIAEAEPCVGALGYSGYPGPADSLASAIVSVKRAKAALAKKEGTPLYAGYTKAETDQLVKDSENKTKEG